METQGVFVRSNSWIERLVVCKECKHVAKDQARYEQHVKEARHINTLRNMAYRSDMPHLPSNSAIFNYVAIGRLVGYVLWVGFLR